MKRRSILFALALMFVVSAIVWSVNYRLSHPALTPTDVEFRALVAGADSVKIKQRDLSNPASSQRIYFNYVALNAAQTRQLVESMRFVNTDSGFNIGRNDPLALDFYKQDKRVARFELYQSARQSELENIEAPNHVYQLHPRSEKPLRRALDEWVPQRVRP